MRLIRRFEERVVTLVDSDEIAGVTHESIGQEAVAAGVCAALGRDDLITSNHRGHGHLLAKGADPGGMMAELMGRSTGLNHGRGGSMHIADFSLGVLGANGIVGAGAPIAAGAAWAAERAGTTRVAVTFFGDGALNQGVLHETLNLAAIWKIPVIFCCENNGYAVTMSAANAAVGQPIDRAHAAGIPAETVDGMDPAAVHAAAAVAVDRARSGGGPSFLDCRTYRFVGHHTAERTMNLKYRPDGELEAWRGRDPLVTWPKSLLARGVATPEALEALDRDVEGVLDAAVAFGREGPRPTAHEAFDYVYASGATDRFPARSAGQKRG